MIDEKQVYIVKTPFKALCCGTEFIIGQKLQIYKQNSKNRLYINAYENELLIGSHNVKRSTFNRCVEKI